MKPEAGSAVFWFNILPGGEADRLTLHGACPVLLGTKWGKNQFVVFLALMKQKGKCNTDHTNYSYTQCHDNRDFVYPENSQKIIYQLCNYPLFVGIFKNVIVLFYEEHQHF